MRIFISWSGERSRLVGELFSNWIKCVLQAVEPWISSNDIDRGSIWFTEINDKLREVSIGILCLTKENKDKPWILFEAGALLKGLSTNRVCTLLIDLEPQDIKDPLAQLNHSLPDKEGIKKLVNTLNIALGERRLQDKVLDDVFETYYPKFQSEFEKILADVPETTPQVERNQNDILYEILNGVRGLEKRVRSLENTSFSDSLYRAWLTKNSEVFRGDLTGNTNNNTAFSGELRTFLNSINGESDGSEQLTLEIGNFPKKKRKS